MLFLDQNQTATAKSWWIWITLSWLHSLALATYLSKVCSINCGRPVCWILLTLKFGAKLNEIWCGFEWKFGAKLNYFTHSIWCEIGWNLVRNWMKIWCEILWVLVREIWCQIEYFWCEIVCQVYQEMHPEQLHCLPWSTPGWPHILD